MCSRLIGYLLTGMSCPQSRAPVAIVFQCQLRNYCDPSLMDCDAYKAYKKQKALAMKKKRADMKKEAAKQDVVRLKSELHKCIEQKEKALKAKVECMTAEEQKAMGDMMDCVMAGVRKICLKSVMQKYCKEQELKLRYERLIKEKKMKELMKKCPAKEKESSEEEGEDPKAKQAEKETEKLAAIAKESEQLQKCMNETAKLLKAELEKSGCQEDQRKEESPESGKNIKKDNSKDKSKKIGKNYSKQSEVQLRVKGVKESPKQKDDPTKVLILDNCKEVLKDKCEAPKKNAKPEAKEACEKPKVPFKDKKIENKEKPKEKECPIDAKVETALSKVEIEGNNAKNDKKMKEITEEEEICPVPPKKDNKCLKDPKVSGGKTKSPYEQKMEECIKEEWEDISQTQKRLSPKEKKKVDAAEGCLKELIKKRCRTIVIRKMCDESWGEPKKENKCKDHEETKDNPSDCTDTQDSGKANIKKCLEKKWKDNCPLIQELTEKNNVGFCEVSAEVKKIMLKICEDDEKNKECQMKELEANIEKCAFLKKCADARLKRKCDEEERIKKCEEEEKIKKYEEEERERTCEELKKTQDDIMKRECELKKQCEKKESAEEVKKKCEEEARRKKCEELKKKREEEVKNEAELMKKEKEEDSKSKCKVEDPVIKCKEEALKKKCKEEEQKRKCKVEDQLRKCDEEALKEKCDEEAKKKKCEALKKKLVELKKEESYLNQKIEDIAKQEKLKMLQEEEEQKKKCEEDKVLKACDKFDQKKKSDCQGAVEKIRHHPTEDLQNKIQAEFSKQSRYEKSTEKKKFLSISAVLRRQEADSAPTGATTHMV
ncbi:axoneme-associated protein mst101(2) [Drosophila gunungcola]|uniref:Axoneme-associated protein mst101(2) n=1 Tax=Drosophila gunungcola TaxID=103775 RepID=A0A9P9YIC4_9MUSC|nr:axoneme-associated protein mst101(2) [Drosophila gunungcola]KAI8037554.1 hypothetical protein M5D96_009707 [Drosophila gunungcola]